MEFHRVSRPEAPSGEFPEDFNQVGASGTVVICTLGIGDVESVEVGTDDDEGSGGAGSGDAGYDGGLDPCVGEGCDVDGSSSSWGSSSDLRASLAMCKDQI